MESCIFAICSVECCSFRLDFTASIKEHPWIITVRCRRWERFNWNMVSLVTKISSKKSKLEILYYLVAEFSFKFCFGNNRKKNMNQKFKCSGNLTPMQRRYSVIPYLTQVNSIKFLAIGWTPNSCVHFSVFESLNLPLFLILKVSYDAWLFWNRYWILTKFKRWNTNISKTFAISFCLSHFEHFYWQKIIDSISHFIVLF